MRITESQLRRIVREEIRESNLKGQTFHVDPVTGVLTAGMSDVEGPGAEMAAKMREPRITGVGRINPNKAVEIEGMAALQELLDGAMMSGDSLEVVLPQTNALINSTVTKIRDPRARRLLKDEMMDMVQEFIDSMT